jgi:hypothetical protein
MTPLADLATTVPRGALVRHLVRERVPQLTKPDNSTAFNIALTIRRQFSIVVNERSTSVRRRAVAPGEEMMR